MIPRIYISHPLRVGQRLDPDKGIRRYLLHVLRLTPSAPLILFNGLDNGEWQGRLTHDSGQIEILGFSTSRRESPLDITLVQGIAKTDAMAFTVQKAVELGVVRIIPLLCRRSRSNAGSGLTTNRQRRLRRIAEEAAEQSGRVHVPEITPPVSWQLLEEHLCSGPRWLFWEEIQNSPSLRNQADPGATVTLLVGPEGGLDTQEVCFAREHLGFITLGLGPRILRTETAALAVITACQLLWGDMGEKKE